MVHAAGDVLPHMDRAVAELVPVIEHALHDDVAQALGEGEPVQPQPVDNDAVTAEYRLTLHHGLGDAVGAVQKTHLARGLDPAEPLMRAGGPEVVALFHVGPPPIHHLSGHTGEKMLAPRAQHESPLREGGGDHRSGQLRPGPGRRGKRGQADVDVVTNGQTGLASVWNIIRHNKKLPFIVVISAEPVGSGG